MNTNNPQTLSPGPGQRFLWWASGATPHVLVECPSEHKKYAAIGASMLFIALVAVTGAGFALEQTFQNLPVAIIGGVLWGALILTVDRLIQISLRKDENKGSKAFWMALPRLLMIVVLSFLITDPLLHKFFEHEIDYQLSLEKQKVTSDAKATAEARNKDETTRLENDVQRLTDGLNQKKDARDKKFDEWMAEGAGTGGTMRRGKGQFYREKEDAFKKADQEYQDEKKRVDVETEQSKARLKELKKMQEEETAQLTGDKAKARGLLARNSALFTIMRHDFGAAVFSIMLMLAFILLESTPLTLKLMSQRGPYDERLDTEEQQQRVAEKQRLMEQTKKIEQDSIARLDASAKLHSLQKAVRDRIADMILNGTRQNLHPEMAGVVDLYAKHVRDALIKQVQKKESSSAGSDVPASGVLTEKPTSIVVRIFEPTEESFTINFNLPEHLVKGRDLLFALPGIEKRFLPQNEQRPALSEYHVVNEAGIVIEPDEPLLAQLKGSRVVNMVLSPRPASDV